MIRILMGLVWAAAMIGLALSANAGLVSREVADPLIVAMPVVAALGICPGRDRLSNARQKA